MSSSQGFLQSQWQPESQMPLRGSLENSTSLLTTIDPSQLHAPLPFPATSQPLHPFSGSNNPSSSLPKRDGLDTPKASQNPETSRPSSSAPPPPSPSTLDLSNVTTTGSQDSLLQTPSRSIFLPNSQPSPISQTSVSAAGASSLSQPGSGTQGSDSYANELPFDVGYGYGFGDGNGETQPLQTQAPLLQSSFDSSEWSQS